MWHPDTASTLNNIGTALHTQGRYPEARRALARALTIFEAALGPAHPRTVACCDDLAIVQAKLQ